MPKPTILSQDEISTALEKMSDWKVVNGNISAIFIFPDFRSAISFITLVAIESEVMDHHPEWSNSYNRVSFSFSTHSVGNKITDFDLKMAKHISTVAKKLQGNTAE